MKNGSSPDSEKLVGQQRQGQKYLPEKKQWIIMEMTAHVNDRGFLKVMIVLIKVCL